jgi:hypothetical protein
MNSRPPACVYRVVRVCDPRIHGRPQRLPRVHLVQPRGRFRARTRPSPRPSQVRQALVQDTRLSVFLDQSSLSANPALWATIERALSGAAHFILLASPESAASPWVRKEIDWWLQHRSMETMLVLLTGGGLVWDSTANDFDWTRTTAISRELSGRFPAEPLRVDLRWAKAEGTCDLKNPKFRAAVLDVAAPLHGRTKDELDGEDIRQNRRTMRVARAVGVVVLISAAVAIWQGRR